MLKSEFYYDLPQELIAQEPCIPRDAARLMYLKKENGAIEHRVFHDLPQILEPGLQSASCPFNRSQGTNRRSV